MSTRTPDLPTAPGDREAVPYPTAPGVTLVARPHRAAGSDRPGQPRPDRTAARWHDADVSRAEPVLLAPLALAGAVAGWGTGRPATAWAGWTAVAVVVVVALSAVLERRRGGPAVPLAGAARAVLVLAAAAMWACVEPAAGATALCWVLAVAAVAPALLPRPHARLVAALAVLALAVPAAVRIVQRVPGLGGPVDGQDAAAASQAALSVARSEGITLLAATVVVAGLYAAGRSLHTAVLATAARAGERDRAARTAAAELERLTTSDTMTGLPNRTVLLERMARANARVDVIGGRPALFALEVDRLEELADSMGTAVRDEMMRQVGRRLRAFAPAEDVVARIGPSRYGILVEGIGPEGCTGLARRMAMLMEEPLPHAGRPVSVTASIGIAVAAPGLEEPEAVLTAAEEALHVNQRSPRARWTLFDGALHADSVSRTGMELDLRQALRSGSIGAAYQPVVALGPTRAQDAVRGMEVLARWTLPDGTAVAPLRFVQMAEEIGAGSTLGRLVLDRALDALVRWRALPADGDGEARPVVDFVSVNLSRSQLEDPDFVTQVAGQLAARELDPSVLMIEVGTAAYVDSMQARSTLGMLKALGVRLALDDFGTEGVSLAGLQALPIEAVKVDPRLTTALGRDDTLVASLTALCRSLGLRCSAEGIETEEQLEAARALGFDTVQGYLLGRPAGALDAAAYLSGPGAAAPTAGR